ncbi:DUF2273 domain-containing protein [Enterococcus villorum]|jgi:uncharacterized membrane protein|uniref:DUF2273 domain-containing protein n=2 Tax=Enterococcus villorum TaxID=112904 RepID=A0A1V8YFV3_9ENTE|nr:DUF2273 domain-containing protein [Enterococcus villorum]EOH87340.1 hypothetical protein UAO_02050 [Enterococcus villorum ATCC 700913]EOW77941.1 hypothetical protein I591_00796 [Enterococcus villorum ATCC 700913]OQO71499.1 DUF2273 domain-containing protein [Enterococcus villorum]OQO76674.1 DUF2273 domain-containing protein [Enterococcus villorum]GEL93137.1 DUF2273 domain-containing protein [Enterococcus villorum]
MNELFETYKLPIICGAIGLILAILLISVGFFKTLLLILMAILGIAVGMYLKQTKIFEHKS